MVLFKFKQILKLFQIHKALQEGISAEKIAVRQNETVRTVQRYFNFLRGLGAEIYYSSATKSHCYASEFDLTEVIREKYKIKIEM